MSCSGGAVVPLDASPPQAGVAVIDPRDPRQIAHSFLADRYADERRTTLIRHQERFYRWTGAQWADLNEEYLRAVLYDFLAGCVRPGGNEKLEPVKPNIKLVSEVLAALRAVTIVPDEVEPPVWLIDRPSRPPHELVAFKNGLLHLPSGEFIKCTPEFFNFNSLTVEWSDEPEEPKKWLEFLTQLWPGDEGRESIRALQQIFGCCLTSSTKLQKSAMIVGPTRSGKGTIGRVLASILGKHNVANPTLSGLGEHFGRQCLIGKSVAIIGDAKLGHKSDPILVAEHILEITGEDGITIPRKGLPDWSGVLRLIFVVFCTEAPKMTDDSAGIAARFIILRLVESFLGREDPDLTDKLLAELPGIAYWAYAGWDDLFGDKGTSRIVQPSAAEGDVEDIKYLASDIKRYVSERCGCDPTYSVERDVLYKDYRNWMAAQGDQPLSKEQFGQKLKGAGVPGLKDRRPREGNLRPRHYSGLKLRV